MVRGYHNNVLTGHLATHWWPTPCRAIHLITFYFSPVQINNVFRRRGASLINQKGSIRSKSFISSPVEVEGSREAEAYVRSIRNSGHSDDYKSLKRLLARRHHWQEPEPESSETVIVRSLPQLGTLQYYTEGRETVARLPRDPSIFRVNRAKEEPELAQRGSLQETPRSLALISPVQNILPEPVAAVPSLPLSSVRLLQPVAAVPNLPVTPRLPVSSVPTVPSVATSSFRSFSRGGSVTLPNRASVTASPSRSPPIRLPSPTQRARKRITEPPGTSPSPGLSTTPASRQISPVPAFPSVFKSGGRPTKAPRKTIQETPRGGFRARGQVTVASNARDDVLRSSSSSSSVSSTSSVVSSVSSQVSSVSQSSPGTKPSASISAPVRHPELG